MDRHEATIADLKERLLTEGDNEKMKGLEAQVASLQQQILNLQNENNNVRDEINDMKVK